MTKKLFVCCTFSLLLVFSMFAEQFQDKFSLLVNKDYGFTLTVDPEWSKIKDEIIDSSLPKYMVTFVLPPVYSPLEKRPIKNVVGINAIKNSNYDFDEELKNIYKRIEVVEIKEIDSVFGKAQILTVKNNDVVFVCQRDVIKKNNVSYEISFTATPGTYDINHKHYIAFLSGSIDRIKEA